MSDRRRHSEGQLAFELVCRPCARFGEAIIGREHRYCRACHAAYMRGWRPGRSLTPVQRRKDIARSYANVYRGRGKLVPKVCACGSSNVEMHHDDYSKPLVVTWMCRPCHLELHREMFDVKHCGTS